MTVTIAPASLPDADNANPYLAFLTADGADGPFKFRHPFGTGDLPSGLHLAEDGGVSGGRAWQLGSFSFDVIAEAADGQSARRQVSIKVVDAAEKAKAKPEPEPSAKVDATPPVAPAKPA